MKTPWKEIFYKKFFVGKINFSGNYKKLIFFFWGGRGWKIRQIFPWGGELVFSGLSEIFFLFQKLFFLGKFKKFFWTEFFFLVEPGEFAR